MKKSLGELNTSKGSAKREATLERETRKEETKYDEGEHWGAGKKIGRAPYNVGARKSIMRGNLAAVSTKEYYSKICNVQSRKINEVRVMGYRLCRLPYGAPLAATHACYTPCVRDTEGASQACANRPIRAMRGSKGNELEKRKNKQRKAARHDTRNVDLGYFVGRE